MHVDESASDLGQMLIDIPERAITVEIKVTESGVKATLWPFMADHMHQANPIASVEANDEETFL
jgi:hypothetical protein